MVVPIDDQDLLEAVGLLGVPGGDGGVAVVARAFFVARVVCVVPGRPYRAEGVADVAAGDGVHGAEGAGHGQLG